ncbi:hypothetical protein [Vibrio sp. ES.051]|nr:hypothetical protein [Vibrio sp. ES.051]
MFVFFALLSHRSLALLGCFLSMAWAIGILRVSVAIQWWQGHTSESKPVS